MICGCLSFYDESPLWLSSAVTGAAKLCDHIIALDGAYALYPNGRARSNPESSEAIVEAANAAGVGLTLHWPSEVWYGNQVEKRDRLFKMAALVEPDWVYVFDADDLVTHVPADIHQRIEQAEEDVAVYTLWWSEDMHATPAREDAAQAFPYPHEAANRYFRGLFRMLPNLRVEGAHYHYVADKDGDTVHLRGHPDKHELAPFLDLTDMRVQHRHPQRTLRRLETSAEYDRLMHALKVEIVNPEDWDTSPEEARI